MEFSKLLPVLTRPRADSEFVFEVIAPSIPGYGWSSPARKKGLNIPQVPRETEVDFFLVSEILTVAEPRRSKDDTGWTGTS